MFCGVFPARRRPGTSSASKPAARSMRCWVRSSPGSARRSGAAWS